MKAPDEWPIVEACNPAAFQRRHPMMQRSGRVALASTPASGVLIPDWLSAAQM
jgi:hypothetical protein